MNNQISHINHIKIYDICHSRVLKFVTYISVNLFIQNTNRKTNLQFQFHGEK